MRYTDCPSLSNSKTCDFNGNDYCELDSTSGSLKLPRKQILPKRVGECREMTLRERNRLSSQPRHPLGSPVFRYASSAHRHLDQDVCPSQVPIGYTTEWAENRPSLQFGNSYSGHVDSSSPPLDDASAADPITGIHVIRAPCVSSKARLKERRRTTDFQIVRPHLKLSCRLRPCDGCGHKSDESQGVGKRVQGRATIVPWPCSGRE